MAEFRARLIGIPVGKRLVLLHEEDAKRNGMLSHDRVRIDYKKQTATAFVETTDKYLERGEIGIFKELEDEFGVEGAALVSIVLTKVPESVEYIRRKMEGQPFTKDQIYSVIQDVVNQNLSELEVAAFLMEEKFQGMSMDEIEYLTRAMVDTGNTIDFERPCYDKHSIGGVPGNKVTLLIIPIVAAAGSAGE